MTHTRYVRNRDTIFPMSEGPGSLKRSSAWRRTLSILAGDERPPGWVRIALTLPLILIVSQLVFLHKTPIELLAGIAACALLLVPIVSPPFLFNERFKKWDIEHRAVGAIFVAAVVIMSIFFLSTAY